MPTATLTSKGRISLPQSVRRALRLQAGAKVDFVPSGEGFMVVPLHSAEVSLKGRFAGRAAGAVPPADMDEAIADEAAARAARRGKRWLP